MAFRGDDRPAELDARERARTRHRDRKRTTRMVVDNAGVKRLLLARAARKGAGGAAATATPPARPLP